MKRSRASALALSVLIASCSGVPPKRIEAPEPRAAGADEELVSTRRHGASTFVVSERPRLDRWHLSAEKAELLFTAEHGIGLSLLRMQIKPNGSTDETATARLAVARGATVWAAPWSPPGSWKTNGTTSNGGALLPEYYEAWADRLVTWVKDRAADGVPLYALSPQNEPNWTADWDTCRYTPEELRLFIRDYQPRSYTPRAPARS